MKGLTKPMTETTTNEETVPPAPMTLTAESILASDDTQMELIDVPEWGGTVWIKGLTGKDRDAFEASMIKGRGKTARIDSDNTRAKFCARVMVDEEGETLFKPGDVEALGRKSGRALDRVYEKGMILSGMTDEEVETLEGN